MKRLPSTLAFACLLLAGCGEAVEYDDPTDAGGDKGAASEDAGEPADDAAAPNPTVPGLGSHELSCALMPYQPRIACYPLPETGREPPKEWEWLVELCREQVVRSEAPEQEADFVACLWPRHCDETISGIVEPCLWALEPGQTACRQCHRCREEGYGSGRCDTFDADACFAECVAVEEQHGEAGAAAFLSCVWFSTGYGSDEALSICGSLRSADLRVADTCRLARGCQFDAVLTCVPRLLELSPQALDRLNAECLDDCGDSTTPDCYNRLSQP